ncbi:MAG TPA: DUF1778 domain-containing protein [Candidatus Baltobacteraceae bacterium]
MKAAVERTRIDFRPRADQKELFERAAVLEGQTLSEFLIRSAEERARRILQEHELLELRGDVAQRLVSLLMNPPPANEALRSAFEAHRRLIDTTED